jgi:hypothetical protein
MNATLELVALQWATLAITTMFAAAAAAGLHWLFLKAAFRMMQPATARRVPARAQMRSDLSRGTVQLARAYSAHR